MLKWTVTGHDSKAELRAETEKLIGMIRDHLEEMDSWEQRFVTDMIDQVALSGDWTPTPKQLFKMRDVNEKY